MRTTGAAAGSTSNHGNNKNVNKIALSMQREHELVGDYALAAQSHQGSHLPSAMRLNDGGVRVSTHAGATKHSAKSQGRD